jgi:hypothetical protein
MPARKSRSVPAVNILARSADARCGRPRTGEHRPGSPQSAHIVVELQGTGNAKIQITKLSSASAGSKLRVTDTYRWRMLPCGTGLFLKKAAWTLSPVSGNIHCSLLVRRCLGTSQKRPSNYTSRPKADFSWSASFGMIEHAMVERLATQGPAQQQLQAPLRSSPPGSEGRGSPERLAQPGNDRSRGAPREALAAARAENANLSPIDYLLQVLRDPTTPQII